MSMLSRFTLSMMWTVLALCAGCAKRQVEGVPDIPGRESPLNLAKAVRPQPPHPVWRVAADPERLNFLRARFQTIAEAYSNRQTKVMRKLYSGVSNELSRLALTEYKSVTMPVSIVYDAEFVRRDELQSRKRSLVDFRETWAFQRYCEAILELSHVLAEADLGVGLYSKLDEYEALPLLHFKLYREQFSEMGRTDLVECADRLIARLIEQIESETGFARRRMQWIYDDNLRYVGQDGTSREDGLKALRTMGSFWMVEVAGYEPRWLKNFPGAEQ